MTTEHEAWVERAMALADEYMAHAQCAMRVEDGYGVAFEPDPPAARAALREHLSKLPLGEPVAWRARNHNHDQVFEFFDGSRRPIGWPHGTPLYLDPTEKR